MSSCSSRLDMKVLQNVILLIVLVIIIMRVCDLMPGLI